MIAKQLDCWVLTEISHIIISQAFNLPIEDAVKEAGDAG